MEGFNLKSEKGNMMMILIGSVVMLATLGFILANIVSSSSKVASLDADEQRAFYAAQSGMEYGLKEYLTADNVDEWTVNDMDGGSGLTLDVSLQKVGNDQIIITSTGKGNNTSKTVQTIISKADSNYVPDYAVFSKKPVVNVVTKDSIAGVYNPGLIYENAASAPVFDNDVLRNLVFEHLALRQHGNELARAHREGTCQQAGDAGQKDFARADARASHAHHQTRIGDETVIDAEHTGPKGPARIVLMLLTNLVHRCRPRMSALVLLFRLRKLGPVDGDSANLVGREHVPHRTRG